MTLHKQNKHITQTKPHNKSKQQNTHTQYTQIYKITYIKTTQTKSRKQNIHNSQTTQKQHKNIQTT